MNSTVRVVRDFFVSLRLTVALLALGLLLVFAGTLAQVELGIWAVQKQFFQSFIAIWKVGPLFVPLPGGYLVGGLLLINLIAAHVYRFRFTWRKAGIFLTHVGLILLLLGELFTGLWQEDYAMRLEEGETRNYAESHHHTELAVVDTSNPGFEEVVAIPSELLARGELLQHPKLPFQIRPKAFVQNSLLRSVDAGAAPPVAQTLEATQGVGTRVRAIGLPVTYSPNARNSPSAVLELIGTGGSLGTWLVSDAGLETPQGELMALSPQRIEHGGRTFTIALRATRSYQNFSLTLLDFRHDRYPGTNIPKNFSSRVQLKTPDGRDDREVLIYMNNPLRYAGLTFYQASFDPRNERVTVLQMVRNPSWWLPYVACLAMTAGLLGQFGIHLFGFFQKRRALAPAVA